MNYFYIFIKHNENLVFLEDTVKLIKHYCLKDSNILSLTINKKMHTNCILDNDNEFSIKVYDTKKNEYENLKKIYQKKYTVNDKDLEILLAVYNELNIEKIEKCKVKLKITYNISFINAVQFIIDILGHGEPICNILDKKYRENFNQMIISEKTSQCIIIENNHLYTAIFNQGIYERLNSIERHDIFNKYQQYKKFDKKFIQKKKDIIQKI